MKKKPSKFRGKVSRDTERQQNATSSYGYLDLPSGVGVFKPTPGGRHTLDIMPYIVTEERHPDRQDEYEIAIPGEPWYKRPFKTHRDVGASNDSLVCPTSVGKKCPICDYREKRRQEGADQEEIKAMYPKTRNLYVVIPIDEKEMKEVPHIWDISQFLFQEQLNKELDENEEFETFPDLEEGFSLKIRFDSDTIGKSKPFATANRIDFEERDAYEEAIMDDIPDLDKVLKVLSYKEIERLFFEMDDDEVEEEETTTRKRKTTPEPEEEERPVRRQKTPEPEVEEEEEVEEEQPKIIRKKKVVEEEEEEAPVRRHKTPEPETEEEEAPKPKRTVKAKSKKDEPFEADEECPSGFRFAHDCEKHDECDVCEKWEACDDASRKL